jgi:parallel beta-helix repeat protein
MKKQRKRIFVLAMIKTFVALTLFLPHFVSAGNLEPPGAPGSTMKTLDQVEPRTPISSLPITISSSGSYYITGDLTSTTDGITINADNVTIDLMGFSITGQKGGGTVHHGIYMYDRCNVEIRNGTVKGFRDHGIRSDGINTSGIRVINVRVIDNGEAGIYLGGYSSLIKDCTAVSNGDFGIGCYTGIITNNNVYDNGASGINGGQGCTLINNAARSNGAHGLEGCNFSIIENNTAFGNTYDGINTSSSTLIGNNVYMNTGDGIEAGDSSTVLNNTAVSNGIYGLNLGSKSGYANNVLSANNGGDSNAQVSGGIEIGTNICGTDTTCP